MTSRTATEACRPVATTHVQAAELFRRPFAPGAIGFRAMMKVLDPAVVGSMALGAINHGGER